MHKDRLPLIVEALDRLSPDGAGFRFAVVGIAAHFKAQPPEIGDEWLFQYLEVPADVTAASFYVEQEPESGESELTISRPKRENSPQLRL